MRRATRRSVSTQKRRSSRNSSWKTERRGSLDRAALPFFELKLAPEFAEGLRVRDAVESALEGTQ